jgi:hypothetical protein
MPTTITINGVSGATPFDIYLCDDPLTTCVYVNTITGGTYSLTVPLIMDGQLSYNLKVVDDNNCEIISNLVV